MTARRQPDAGEAGPAESALGTRLPPVVDAGAEQIARRIERFHDEVAAIHERLAEAVRREVTGPVVEAASRAADEHARIREALRLDAGSAGGEVGGEAGGSAGGEAGGDVARERLRAWRLVVRYRWDTRTRVLDAFRERLAAIDPGQRLADLWADARAGLVEAANRAPPEVLRLEPAEAFAPRPGDPVGWRVRKAGVRAGRRLAAGARGASNLGRRVVGRDATPPPVLRQTVPLRDLLHFHAVDRVIAADREVLDSVRTRLARSLSDFERDEAAWADALLELDALLDRPDHHAAPGAPAAAPPAGDDFDEEEGAAEASDPAAELEAAARAASVLEMALDSLASGEPSATMPTDLAAGVDEARTRLAEDLERVGTFMLDPSARSIPGGVPGSASEREARWVRWFGEILARMDLDGHLERLRDRLLTLLEAYELELVTEVVEPARRALDDAHASVTAIRREVEEVLGVHESEADLPALKERLARVGEEVTEALEEHVFQPLGRGDVAARVREQADRRVGEVQALIEALPDSLGVHEPATLSNGPDPDGKSVAVRLRPIAEQAYDAVLLERFRVAPDPLAAAIVEARTEARQLEKVIRFNLDSALEELGGDGPVEDRVAGARELALNGIDRTLHTLAELSGAIAAEVPTVRQRLFDAHVRGWEQIHDRVRVEDRMQEQILDFGYRARTALRGALGRARKGTAWAARRGRRLARVGRGRALRLVRMGQTALEGERVTEQQKRQTIDALSTIHEVLAGLPLVYRRLFSFQPVNDPALLEGRSADLDVIAGHFAQWRRGLTDAFLITGYDGNGRTSFLNVVRESVFSDANVRRLRLTERILDEAELTARLARTLDLEGGGARTLDQLAERLRDRRAAGPDRVPLTCILENLEHLFLRTSSDNGLIAAFLAFLSKTDSSVFWLATIAEPAWSYIEKVEPTTAALVRRHPLSSVSRPALEAIILNRHLRSGLDLEFHPHPALSPLLRRRLARARHEEERQAILRTDYFDQLHRLVGQNLLLALLYWIRSVELDAGTGVVRVGAVEPISFAFLDGFTLSQSFTLKAFLDHATLTLDEHERIFQLPRHETRNLFESLGNLLLIEPADTSDRVGEFHFSTVEPERRYRIRPIVVHPVLVHLRARNIVS